jgi:hypothetical protein
MNCKQDPNVTELYDEEAELAGKAPERKRRKLVLPDNYNSAMFINDEFADGEESEIEQVGYRVERET